MVDHLLVHCSKAKVLCDLLLAIFGVCRVFPLFVRVALFSWHDSFVSKRCKKAWMTTPLCIFFEQFAAKETNLFFTMWIF